MLYRNSCVKMSDISDGSTNTIMIGDSLYGFWADGYSCCVRVWDDVDHPDLWDSYWAYKVQAMDGTYLTLRYFSFGSAHGQLCNFALADGSTQIGFQTDLSQRVQGDFDTERRAQIDQSVAGECDGRLVSSRVRC